MSKKKSEEFDLEDILASLDEDEEENNVEDLLATLDDEEETEDQEDLIDILSELDDEDTSEEKNGSSFNDYASLLIKELEDEMAKETEDKDNLSTLGSMVEANENSDLDGDDLLSILDNLDSLEDEETNNDEDDELIGLLSEDEEEVDEDDDRSIEELFNDFINAVKGLSDDEKDIISDKIDKISKIFETDDLTVAGLSISEDGIITQTDFNKSLKKLTIKKSYNGIKVRKFISAVSSEDDDIELEEVIFEGDIYIESSFVGCPNLNKLEVKGNLEIGPYNFVVTPNLDVEVDGNRYERINGNDYYVLRKGVYKSHYVNVKYGCKLIDSHSFLFSKILMIDIPSSVKKIGRSAFAECYELDYVSFSEGLQYIEEAAFNGCRKLESVDLPDSLLKIGSDAFKGCDKLMKVSISKNTKFEEDSFPSHTKIVYR